MLERLEREFVNCWVLHKDLEPLMTRKDDPELARVARVVSKAYQYPVDSQVLSPAGELLAQAGVDEVMVDEARYLELLDAAGAGTGR